jgi:hypothetical protein
MIYILISRDTYPQRCAHECLEELQRTFLAKIGESRANSAKSHQLDGACASLMRTILEKYDNVAEIDKLAEVTKKVESIKLVMTKNIDEALQNCVKLEAVQKKAEELHEQAGVFKRNATTLKNKMWWKNFRMILIIGIVVLLGLGGAVGVAVVVIPGPKLIFTPGPDLKSWSLFIIILSFVSFQ